MAPKPRFEFYMQDKDPLAYELEMAEYAENRGFSAISQADTRPIIDAFAEAYLL